MPVQYRERHADVWVDHLHRLLQAALPDKTGAQYITSIHRGLPGGQKTLRIKSLDIQPHLVGVTATLRLIQGMEQHATLHRRQGIHILNRTSTGRQFVQLLLGQSRQREIRGCQATMLGLATMFNQLLKFTGVFIGQALNHRLTEHLLTEGPTQAQLTAIHLAIE
ncbi:hypothetical protein [Pseudomonas sp. 25 R 14]|nr:hypothetical protein [Pseudomonas sp. 25 R 14]